MKQPIPAILNTDTIRSRGYKAGHTAATKSFAPPQTDCALRLEASVPHLPPDLDAAEIMLSEPLRGLSGKERKKAIRALIRENRREVYQTETKRADVITKLERLRLIEGAYLEITEWATSVV